MIATVVTPSQKKRIWKVYSSILLNQKNHTDLNTIYLKKGFIGETDLSPLFDKRINWVTFNKFYKVAAFYNTDTTSIYNTDTEAAIAYLEGVGITLTDPQKVVLDRHVRDLHGEANGSYTTYDIWALLRAAYPVIGGTAAGHALNLRNPAQPLTFSGGITHSATGMLFNGSTGYANTGLSMDSQPILAGCGYYSRVNSGVVAALIGGGATDPTQGVLFFQTTMKADLYGSSTRIDSGVASTLGYFSVSRLATNNLKIYRNGLQQATSTAAGLPPGVANIVIGAHNTGGVINLYTSTECAYADINYGLTSAQELALYNSIQAFQTGWSRQV